MASLVVWYHNTEHQALNCFYKSTTLGQMLFKACLHHDIYVLKCRTRYRIELV